MALEHEQAVKERIIPPVEKLILMEIARTTNDNGEGILDYTGLAVAASHTSDVTTRQKVKQLEDRRILQRKAVITKNEGQTQNKVYLDKKELETAYPKNPILGKKIRRQALKTGEYRTPPPHEHVMTPPHEHVMTPSEYIHELNSELNLNSEKKFSTGKPKKAINPKVAAFNQQIVEAFEPSSDLLAWAGHNCPLVPVETTTALWREWVVANMGTRLKSATAHWRDFLRNQQTWRAEHAKEREGLYVGGNGLALVPDAGNAPAVKPAPVPAAVTAEVDEVEAAIQAMSTEAVATLRAEVEMQIAAKMADRFKLWDDDTKRATINANLRRIVREQLQAQRAEAA